MKILLISSNKFDILFQVFFVAGNPQLDVQSKKGESQRGERSERGLTRKPAERDTAGNVFSGMDERVLAEAFNVNTDVARRLRGEDDYRGMIVTVERGLEVLTPQRSPEEERQIFTHYIEFIVKKTTFAVSFKKI